MKELTNGKFEQQCLDEAPESGGIAFRPEPSMVAKRVQTLKNSAFNAVKKRDRLAQPLFWSLFLSEINEIKQAKARQKLMRKILLGVEDI